LMHTGAGSIIGGGAQTQVCPRILPLFWPLLECTSREGEWHFKVEYRRSWRIEKSSVDSPVWGLKPTGVGYSENWLLVGCCRQGNTIGVRLGRLYCISIDVGNRKVSLRGGSIFSRYFRAFLLSLRLWCSEVEW